MPRALWDDIASARRIVIGGVTGAGKSTAATRLAAVLTRFTGRETRAIDFDEIGWEPASVKPWTHRPSWEQRQLASEAIQADSWVMTRPWSSAEDIVFHRAQLVIYLDYPPRTTLARLFRRTITRIIRREPCCNGNRESLARLFSRDSIIYWWLKTVRSRHDEALELETAPSSPLNPPVLRLTHPSQMDAVLSLYRAK
ncbi:topology modulation protein [Corynebacterium endometrii]|uniref:Topology modulation protein n=1 Tax=Corynebacterium endometrii TaxID=2488819 RepID=A0A4P7QFK2_9CORY|nr:topology modulation protein [Corynebacterium endometrii]